MLSRWKSLPSPGRVTNLSQVSSQQTLVLKYLPRKDGKLSWLRQKRRSHKIFKSRQSRDRTGVLVVRKQRSYNCTNHAPTFCRADWKLEILVEVILNSCVLEITTTNSLFYVTVFFLATQTCLSGRELIAGVPYWYLWANYIYVYGP